MPIHSANRSRSRESFPALPNPSLYRNIAYTFVGITVVIVVVALWLSSVHATVTVKAAREQTTVQASVEVAHSPEQGQLPGRVVEGVFEKIQDVPVASTAASSSAPVDPNMVASGKVRITNEYSSAMPLVVNTRLLTTDGRLYRINESVNVPAKGSVDVEAHADKKGQQFAFFNTTKFTIPGLSDALQKVITAESISPFSGDGAAAAPQNLVTQAMIDSAEKDLQAAILEQAKKTLLAEVADSQFTNAVYVVKPVEMKTSVQAGKAANSFLVSVKLDVTGVFYAIDDMNALVKQRLEERIPEGRDIVAYDPSNIQFSVSQVSAKNEKATVTASAQVQTKLSDKSSVLDKDLIVGLPIDQAESKLEEQDGVSSVQITVRPSWVSRLPTQKDHITIKVE
jgi:hypothetical protein